MLEFLASAVKQEKEIEDISSGKEEGKVSLLRGGKHDCLEKSDGIYETTRASKFSKVVGRRINI